MDLPATHYGKLDKRNPVVSVFERDVKTFITLMRRVTSTSSQDNSSYAKGIKTLVEIWKKYKHRLPSKMYEERMLQVADFLVEIELYEVALWQGYSLHLLQFSPLKITDIADVDHFMACFFPKGLDMDQDTFTLKIRAMQGCALCIFEQEKKQRSLAQAGLCKLLQVLDFLRIMMQVLQQYEHLCWHVYNISLHIYKICHYLMTMNCSAQALEYLLWASVSLELSVPIMTPEYLPWIVTLYCAVCCCYYDGQLPVQAEEFARRALGKIDKLARWEQENNVPANRQTQIAFREASIKLAAMVFKRLVFETGKKIKPVFKPKTKTNVKELPNVPWPRTTTERVLMSLFDSNAAYFLGILEALRNTGWCPQVNNIPEEQDPQEVIMELLSAGLSVLSGDGSEPLGAMTTTPTLIELAIAGENKVNVSSALSFIKLLFQYKQSETCIRLTKEMLQVLSTLEGQSFRKAESELTLLGSFNSLLCSERSCGRDDIMPDVRGKSLFPVSEELTGLVRALHSSVCLLSPESRPDGGIVLDVVLFLWNKVKKVMQGDELQDPAFTYCIEKIDNFDKWLWCLFELCEVTSVCDLANMDCMMAAEMTYMLAVLLERAAESRHHTPTLPADRDKVNPTSFSLTETSKTEWFQKVCQVVDWGLKALEKNVATLLPQDGSAITDSVLMQKGHPLFSLHSRPCGLRDVEGESQGASNNQDSQHTESTCVSLLAKDLYLELLIIQHRASLKLIMLNGVTESEILGRIKKNKVSKAVFLIQKALLMYTDKGTNDSKNQIKSLLEEASSLIDKASAEERKLYLSSTFLGPAENEDSKMKDNKDDPPPAPILLSRTDTTLTFAPVPYNLQGQSFWYQLYGHATEGVDQKVHIGDCSLKGTGNLVPAVPGECLLKVEGLEPNQKYVFAVAVYNSQGNMLGNGIGATTLPILASMPIPLLSTWALMAQVAYQSKHFALAKRACRTLWSHFTYPDNGSQRNKDRLSTTTGLHTHILQCCSLHILRWFLTSIFIDTDINIQQGSLSCQSFSHNGPFIWEQEARLEECERMLVAMDLALWLNDGISALQAVVTCYGLLTPLIFHQVHHSPIVEVLKKCLVVLEVISSLPKQKWNGRTSESFVHMIACITYYLVKTLRALRETHEASVMLDSGRKLLKKAHDAWLQLRRISNKTECITAVKGEKVLPLLRALRCKNGKSITCEAADTEIIRPSTSNLTSLYDQISDSTVTVAYQHVMKLKSKPYFLEVAAQLVQRAMEEGHMSLVLKWGKSIFQSLSRREHAMGLSKKSVERESQSDKRVHQKSIELPQQNSNKPNKTPACKNDKRKTLKLKMPCSMLQKVKTNREMQIVESLIARMTSVVERQNKQIQNRKMCCEERVWKSHLNYSLAKACLELLYHSLDQSHGGFPEHRYSQVDPLCFSLPFSGIILRKNTKKELVSKETSSSCKEKTDVDLVDDSVSEESSEEEEMVEQEIDMRDHCAELFNRAALHLRRAMVLAHRGSHWTLLRCVCQTVWDHSCRIGVSTGQCEPPVTPDQLNDTLTSLLVLSTDLIMDMMHRLGLWSLYDGDFTEEELESTFHYSATLDDSTQVDLRWVRVLVLHTLERLHDSAKWESLAHFGLVFNAYTRDHHALTVTPLIINAQRRLLERINSLGGPTVPQPHHVKTQKTSGKQVTYSTYAGCQLVSGWAPLSEPQTAKSETMGKKNPIPPDTAALKGAEMQRSMCLVRVPLNVEDTLSCYRQAFERRPQCLLVFQRSHTLLLRLLANTQPCFMAPLHHSEGRRQVKFNPALDNSPNAQSHDLDEDFCNPSTVYKLPVSPDNMTTVTDAFSASIKYLEDNGKTYLRVVALHEMGNLQFYHENRQAAHLYWSKAVNCALQSSRVIEQWDGVSIGGESMEKTLKQAGIWGCLHAAGLTAKIAQYTLTSDITQRTKYCLLSAHLFKCVLCCSMAQPQADLQYAHHSIGEELLPGTDLFSEPHRVPLGTTVASLKFLCHWLFTKGFYMTLLPMLALYLHVVGTVCRDVERTVEVKILKIRALTELCLFAEAVKESVELIRGTGTPLPYGQYVVNSTPQPMNMFYNSKCLQDNMEALEELVNSDFAPDIRMLYGSTLCLCYNLARVQLILALCNTIHGTTPLVAESVETEACATMTSSSKRLNQDTEGSCLKPEQPKHLNLTGKEKLSPGQLKFALLEGASSLLGAALEQLSSQSCSEAEILVFTIESNLLRNNLYLQQGQFALSAEMAVSSLALLQTSPIIMSRSSNDTGISAEQREDASRAVEASERIGVHLWLRCRLALFQSLSATVSFGVPPLQGKTEEALQVLQEGLDECERWGELDIQGLLMLEGAKLEAERGKMDNCMAMLKETINLLSGETNMPPGSTLTVARAILLLSDLREGHNTTLLSLLYGLIKNELSAFGQSVVLENGQMSLFPPKPSNIYLPYLELLHQDTAN